MATRRFVVTAVTDASGNATVYTPPVSGYIQTIRFVNTDLASTVDFTVTAEATGEAIWSQSDVSASTTVAPRQATHSTAGVAALYASGGTAVNDRIALSRDRVKFVLAQGGNTKSGKFHVVVVDAA